MDFAEDFVSETASRCDFDVLALQELSCLRGKQVVQKQFYGHTLLCFPAARGSSVGFLIHRRRSGSFSLGPRTSRVASIDLHFGVYKFRCVTCHMPTNFDSDEVFEQTL